MGVPTSEVGYTSATARRGEHESSYEHVVALEKKILTRVIETCITRSSPDYRHQPACLKRITDLFQLSAATTQN